ncbi:MAG: DUF3052 domain-containing protein [Acidimicrobiales bacterium]
MESGSTPSLSTKLGIKDASTVMLLHAPTNFMLNVARSVNVKSTARGRADVILAFFTSSTTLSRQIESLSRVVYPTGSLWFAWPKRTSALGTDLSDHVVRGLALPLGLVDNKVCAVDDTWTALRFVWRIERRTTSS